MERIWNAAAFIITVLGVGLLHGPILNFYFVTGHKAKLGLIAAYTFAFALCAGLLKRSEIFSACAEYAAVIVVFVEQWLGQLDCLDLFV